MVILAMVDTLAKIAYEDRHLLYKYKGVVEVPHLEMVNDVITIPKCSITVVTQNVAVNAFMERHIIS